MMVTAIFRRRIILGALLPPTLVMYQMCIRDRVLSVRWLLPLPLLQLWLLLLLLLSLLPDSE